MLAEKVERHGTHVWLINTGGCWRWLCCAVHFSAQGAHSTTLVLARLLQARGGPCGVGSCLLSCVTPHWLPAHSLRSFGCLPWGAAPPLPCCRLDGRPVRRGQPLQAAPHPRHHRRHSQRGAGGRRLRNDARVRPAGGQNERKAERTDTAWAWVEGASRIVSPSVGRKRSCWTAAVLAQLLPPLLLSLPLLLLRCCRCACSHGASRCLLNTAADAPGRERRTPRCRCCSTAAAQFHVLPCVMCAPRRCPRR